MKLMDRTLRLGRKLIQREVDYHLIRPSNVLLFLTYRCTSRCNTCTMWQREVDQAKEMGLAQWKHLIDSLSGQRIVNVELFGGDVLLRKELVFALTRYIKGKGIPRVEIATNGNLIDRETAGELLDCGIDVFYLSLDGVGEVHDRVRGVPGSFKNIKRALEALVVARNTRGTKHQLFLQCTISALNLENFEEVLPFAREIGVDVIAFEYVGEFPEQSIEGSSIGNVKPEPYYSGQPAQLLLNTQQARLLKKKIAAIKEENRPGEIEIITRNIDCLSIENLTSGIMPNKKCYMIRYMITVDPFGNVIPCAFFNNNHLGNIRSEDFKSVWVNQKHRDFIRCVDQKKTGLCKYCILSVQRNATILQSLQKSYFSLTGKGLDQ